MAIEVERAVKCGLATHRRQDRIGTFLLDNFLNYLPVDRLDVRGIRHRRVCHNSCGV